MRLRTFLLLPMILSICGGAYASKERVSILDFMRVGPSAQKSVTVEEAQYLTQQVRDAATSLLDAGRFDIMTRENILVMLPPGKKDLSECEGQCEVETARNLGSRWHVVGDVKKVGTKLVLSVRLYDVESGTQLGGVSVRQPSVDGLADSVVPAARELFARIPGSKLGAAGAPVPVSATSAPVAIAPSVPAASTEPDLVLVELQSEPSGAEVAVDGMVVCASTPCKRSLLSVRHQVRLRLAHYADTVVSFKPTFGNTGIVLVMRLATANLSVSAVQGKKSVAAKIVVDGREVGTTPQELVLSPTSSLEVRLDTAARKYDLGKLKDGERKSLRAEFTEPDHMSIPAGCFEMGSPDGVGGSDERPQHRVCLDGFSMDATPVTQSAYQQVMGSNPSQFKDCGGNCPVENVNWMEASDYCRKVGKRLPTEAEWEYAARAGTTTKWCWGDDTGSAGDYAWSKANSDGRTHPVAQKRPNGWGLYDMVGNVWEWTADWYGGYSPAEEQKPTGPSSGSLRVSRGGSWSSLPVNLRSAYRSDNDPDGRNTNLGFRCVGP